MDLRFGRTMLFFVCSVLFLFLVGGFFASNVYAADCSFAATDITHDFSLPANWTCGFAPTVTDNALIPAGEEARVYASTQINNLNVSGTLQVLEGILDINGNGAIDTGAVVTSTSAIIRFDGATVVNNGSIGTQTGMVVFDNFVQNDGQFDVGAGTINSYHLTNNGVINGGTGTFWIQSFWSNAGTFNPELGVVRYVLVGPASAPDVAYHDLRVELGTLNLTSDVVVPGTFLMDAGAQLRAGLHAFTVLGSSTIQGGTAASSTSGLFRFADLNLGGTIDSNTGGMIVAGAFNNNGTFQTQASSTFVGEVTNSGTIQNDSLSSDRFTFVGAVHTNPGGAISSGGVADFLFQNTLQNDGSLYIGGGVVTSTEDFTNTGNVYGETGRFILLKNWINTSGGLVPGTGTVVYRGPDPGSPRTVPDVIFYNLNIEPADTVTIFHWAATSTILGDLNIAVDANFTNVSSLGELVILGNINNAGIINPVEAHVTTTGNLNNTGGFYGGRVNAVFALGGNLVSGPAAGFNPQSGLFKFIGAGTQTADGVIYYNLGLDKITNARVILQASSTVLGYVSSTSAGTLDARSYPLTIVGTTTLHEGVVTSTSGTLTFQGAVSSSGAIGSSSGDILFEQTLETSGTFDVGAGSSTVVGTLTNAGLVQGGAGALHVPGDLLNTGLITTSTGGVIVHPVDSLLITDEHGSLVTLLSSGGSLYVTLRDQDRNRDGSTQETITIPVASDLAAGNDTEPLTLTETAAASGIFRNTSPLSIRSASVSPGNGFLDLTGTGVGSASYVDTGDASSTTVTLNFIALHEDGGDHGGGGGGGGGDGGGGGRMNILGGGGDYHILQLPSDMLAPSIKKPITVIPQDQSPSMPVHPIGPVMPTLQIERGSPRVVDLSIPPSTDCPVYPTLSDRQLFFRCFGVTQDLEAEQRGWRGAQEDTAEFHVSLTDAQAQRIALFIAYGATDRTRRLGERERRALVRDTLEMMQDADISIEDLDRLSNGQVPFKRNLAEEQQRLPLVRQAFRQIYGRDPNLTNSQENLAWNTLMYRLRFQRDLLHERKGVQSYKQLYHSAPTTPFHWAIVRVLGYLR